MCRRVLQLSLSIITKLLTYKESDRRSDIITIKNIRIDQILDLTNAINAKGANTDGAMMFIQTPKEGMYNISGIFENIT